MLLYLFRPSRPLQVIDRLFTKILINSKNYVCWVLVGILSMCLFNVPFFMPFVSNLKHFRNKLETKLETFTVLLILVVCFRCCPKAFSFTFETFNKLHGFQLLGETLGR